MTVAANGDAHFKNIATRNYLVLRADGTLQWPTDGGPYRLGLFAPLAEASR